MIAILVVLAMRTSALPGTYARSVLVKGMLYEVAAHDFNEM